jgi:cytochrome c biogenesis factor
MMILFGVRPWEDPSYFYATMAAVLSALVIFTVISEFVRGGRVIAGKSQQNLFSAMIHLYHRNTRRYGGYIVHFGVALVVIGILGTPFNKEVEKEMGFGDKINIGPTRWSASPTRRTTIPTTATSGRSSTYFAAASRLRPCIPSAASTRPANSRRLCRAFIPASAKIYFW